MNWTKCFIFCIIISLSFAKRPKKIFGGTRADIHDHTYVVSVQFLGTHLCGGSIMNPNYVLTSSSCVLFDSNVIAGNLIVITSTDDLLDESINHNSIYEVSHVIYHEQYDAKEFWRNDIALLKIAKQMIFSDTCWSIDLPVGRLPTQKLLEVTGWGETNENNEVYTPSRHLHVIELRARPANECMQIHRQYDGLAFTYPSFGIGCASNGLGYQAVTPGDGGGGAVFNDRVVGIVSVCMKETNSIVFTKTNKHEFWIEYGMILFDRLINSDHNHQNLFEER